MLVSVVTVLVGIVTTITAPQFESRIKKGEGKKKRKKKNGKKEKRRKKKGGRSDLTSILTVARCAEPRHPVRLVAVVVVAAVPVAGGTKCCLES